MAESQGRSYKTNVDASSWGQLHELASRVVGRVCIVAKVRVASARVELARDPANTVDDAIILWTEDSQFTLFDANDYPVLVYDQADDGIREGYEIDNDATEVLQPLVGSAATSIRINPNDMTLVVVFDNRMRLFVGPLMDHEDNVLVQWSILFGSGEGRLLVGPGLVYAREYPDDPLPPPPYLSELRLCRSLEHGPDNAARGPFSHEAYSDDDLLLVQGVLDDLLGQPCVRAEVYRHTRDTTLHFGAAHEDVSPMTGRKSILGEWSVRMTRDTPITLTGADGARLLDGVPSADDNPTLAALVGARVTGAQVHLDDLGLTLALHPPATAHPPPNPYESFWRLPGPDRPQRVLDVGQGGW